MNPLSFEIKETTCRIHMPSFLAATEAEVFRSTYPKICQGHPEINQIALDFGNTDFMDARGLRALAAIYATAQQQAIDLLLERVSSQVMLVLAITGLDQAFTIQPSLPISSGNF